MARHYPGAKVIYLPDPTWGNHIPIFKDSGLEIRKYRYFDKKTVGLDFAGLKEDIQVNTAATYHTSLSFPFPFAERTRRCHHSPSRLCPQPYRYRPHPIPMGRDLQCCRREETLPLLRHGLSRFRLWRHFSRCLCRPPLRLPRTPSRSLPVIREEHGSLW